MLFQDEDFVLIHFESFLTSIYLLSCRISNDKILVIDQTHPLVTDVSSLFPV
jgi:hypothetical protein